MGKHIIARHGEREQRHHDLPWVREDLERRGFEIIEPDGIEPDGDAVVPPTSNDPMIPADDFGGDDQDPEEV